MIINLKNNYHIIAVKNAVLQGLLFRELIPFEIAKN